MRNWTTGENPTGNLLKDQGSLWKGVTSGLIYLSSIFSDANNDDTQFRIYTINQDAIQENGYSGITAVKAYDKNQGTDDAYYNEDFSRVPFFSVEGDRMYVRLDSTGNNLDTGATTLAISAVTGELR